jgi:hypothetical protein
MIAAAALMHFREANEVRSSAYLHVYRRALRFIPGFVAVIKKYRGNKSRPLTVMSM